MPIDADVPALFARAVAEFTVRVHRIDGRWADPTPLPGWDVRRLVHHLVEEQRWAPPLFAGRTIADVGDALDGDLLGDDPAGAIDAVDRAAPAAVAAVAEPGALDRAVHLSFGDHPGREYALQLAADHLVHAWDLARALGEDPVVLDPGVVAALRAWFPGTEDTYRALGVIGARGPVRAGAGPQDELLAMFGRDPAPPALAAVERFEAAFGAHDVDAVMAAMTPDCVFEDTTPPDGRRHEGAAAVRAAWEELFAASPDAAFTCEERIVAGDSVVQRWRYGWDGGHVRGVDVFTVRDGLVAAKLSYVKG